MIHMRQFDNFFRDGDWNCLKCGANNFSRRTFCFKPECKAQKPREERGSYRGDRRDSEGPHPGEEDTGGADDQDEARQRDPLLSGEPSRGEAVWHHR